MQVTIQEFNDVINNGADEQVKAALFRFLERVKTAPVIRFEIEVTATEIEQVFERLMVDEFRKPPAQK